MNHATFRLAREIRRHLIAMAEELARWLEAQPGHISHEHDTNEPTASQSPRFIAGNGKERGDPHGSSRR
jgi:hypothetical protein